MRFNFLFTRHINRAWDNISLHEAVAFQHIVSGALLLQIPLLTVVVANVWRLEEILKFLLLVCY